MSWVTVERKGKRKGKFKCKFTSSMLFAMKIMCGDYLYNNPDDEEMKALYAELPARADLTETKVYSWASQPFTGLYKNPTLYLDAEHLEAIRRLLPLLLTSGWTQERAVKSRIKSFDEIPVLVMLAAACE